MGVAGVAILGMLYSIFKSMVSIVSFFIWKRKTNATGVVKALKEKKFNYENEKKQKISSIKYIYDMYIDNNGSTHMVDYVEEVSGDKPSKVAINSSLEVFVDLDKNIAKSKKNMINQIWQWPLIFIFCSILLIVCLMILDYL